MIIIYDVDWWLVINGRWETEYDDSVNIRWYESE